MKFQHIVLFLFAFASLSSCNGNKFEDIYDLSDASWEEITELAKGQTVDFMMWTGDPKINSYIRNIVAPAVKEKYDINLEISSGQGVTILQLIMTEIQANQPSNIDMVWINGETFYQLRQIDGLYGPFLDKLPNSTYLNLDNPFIGIDFQYPIDGMEVPWGNVQMTIIYDSERVEKLPQTRAELLEFVKKHPGQFTWDNSFTGMTFLKALLIDIAGGDEVLKGDFNPKLYDKYSKQLWDYLKELKPYLWRQGKVYPESVAQMHQLFANGELIISMSNNDAEVDNKISEGLFTDKAKAYVPDFGTIQNSHYLGIPKNSLDKAAAIVVINHMISPEAQLQKQIPEIWGDGTVLSLDRLPEEYRRQFNNIPGRINAPKRENIQSKARQELAPEYMIRLYKDFRHEIIEVY